MEKGKDVDHKLDKQLGSGNELSNLGPLDSSVNRSFGSQIGNQLRNAPYGTIVTAVTLLYAETASAASNITITDVAEFAVDISPIGDIKTAIDIFIDTLHEAKVPAKAPYENRPPPGKFRQVPIIGM
ncbi:hypothetical protein ACO0K3_15235 [Undibacterium sp. Rencai35W]|uniref:hypothetical protein n=1 Tax=Undibacterium sp. Rencai35W TaxID=3413046 RepID=UPI003BEFA11C